MGIQRELRGGREAWGKNLRAGSVHGPTLQLLRGWPTSVSSLLDLKPPRLVMRAQKRRRRTLSRTKVLFSKSPEALGPEAKASPEGRASVYLCDCIDETASTDPIHSGGLERGRPGPEAQGNMGALFYTLPAAQSPVVSTVLCDSPGLRLPLATSTHICSLVTSG